MANYEVTWQIDAEEMPTPRAAAEHARALQLDGTAWVGCFTVRDVATGETTDIDLDQD